MKLIEKIHNIQVKTRVIIRQFYGSKILTICILQLRMIEIAYSWCRYLDRYINIMCWLWLSVYNTTQYSRKQQRLIVVERKLLISTLIQYPLVLHDSPTYTFTHTVKIWNDSTTVFSLSFILSHLLSFDPVVSV